MSKMKLRKYQTDLIDRTRAAFKNGNRAPLAVLPCRAGKTVIFAYMAREHVKRGGYVHFYVHRRELMDQTLDTFTKFNIPTDNIYIGTVQSRSIHEHDPSLIIFDEAHHATAKLWTNITERYPAALIIGLTATPVRSDGSNLNYIFDTLIEGVDANWLIKNNYLAPFDYYAPQLSSLNNSDILIERGNDYDGAAIGKIMLKSKIYGDIEKYLHKDKKTIIYAPSIEFSTALERLGAVHIDGTTPKAVRDDIISKFRSGEIMHITNVDLFGEGFDVPDCEVVVLLRPTKSTALFIQQTMRAMTYVEGKTAIIYDLVGNVFTHGMPTDYYDWDLNGEIKPKFNEAKDVIVRMCDKCFRVYAGISPVCPYCEYDNGKSALEIKLDEQAELTRINDIEIERKAEVKKQQRMEVGRARTLEHLTQLATERGYKNPDYWARMILKGRKKI